MTERIFVNRDEALPAGKTVVGVDLPAGDYPAGITIGDDVALFGTGDQSAAAATDLGIGQVRYAQIDERSGDLVADIVIDEATRLRIVQAQAVDRLRIGLISGTG